ncbi:uncharacterized protein LOC107410562 isoform X1 [Ziziphus jujuba]|uniref:Uncharacterized protein LOC107410562 isoform X1 n=1 Tax=Ziziphus jujuba TaxID=326968 RepID=A0A6P6FXX5_ZIZJJ|nr:uncharacterized protein LOC107410562 isoform X1 [Ziziphus jujuba]XP_024926855.1 uncharacterized protein LOC107410562 isoform X1 [Ziziphus jujuba]XP_024926856.1 uncharacterized protein LOC107410562 isoform X1 [Ziziphus jujuba]XP_024926857.1 uncharacterized protein LOC107410562 isoform X1 [Ziziphus jujuba]XP_048324219.1 uncharacterized protein LOC107410562 isoform X1 [Ziziphus jujuba var. spinosa]XP_048324220.1 uncharacterized protein LOC107410562 isoform X1 [Ziziphus jujuba var. spinosa]
MAIAGLHNVSVLDSSFLRESHAQAPRQVSEEGRVSTRASSLLQMWRELEDEHVVSHAQERIRERLFQQRTDECDLSRTETAESHGSEHTVDLEDVSIGENESSTWSEGQTRSHNEHEVSSNFNSEHSSDFGEVERERVRQIFRGWMNTGVRGCTSSVSHITNSPSRAEWLGETEQERVRVIREWVQMNSQQRGAFGNSREEQPAEPGSQIERVRDGLVVNQNGGRNEHSRRGIRRLCGRQALLDMLKKAERERQIELQGLSEHRAVSNFPHRNRIQSLLRGWFLRNGRLIDNEKPSSVAESELGLLRQRHTVSGLSREGFFSRLDNSACAQASSLCDTSNSDVIGNRSEATEENNLHESVTDFCARSVHSYEANDDQTCDSHGVSGSSDDLGGNMVEDMDSCLESNAHVEGWHEQVPDNVVREREWSTSAEIVERRDDAEPNVVGSSQGDTVDEWVHEEHRNLQEVNHVSNDQSEHHVEGNLFHSLSDREDNIEGSRHDDDINWQQSASHLQQWQDQGSENDEREWEQTVVEYTATGLVENTDTNHQESNHFEWTMGNEDRENSHLQQAHEEWQEEGGFQEAVQNWLEEEPSDPESLPARQADTFYFPDDDNVYSVELRELLSRRRVSNLLHSGFRESLNQLIQSYVERQGHVASDWELHGSSPSPASVEQDLEQMSGDPNEVQGNPVDSHPLSLPSQPIRSSLPNWDQESQHDNWTPHDMHQRLGIEWDIVNDLRIDMARLQQRMNNLQRMLEACMDMQLELQRSIRQEVSAALNRSSGSQGLREDSLAEDGSKWDHVRKGVCCICCDSNIDSLLYRCGHMCACSKCANELVESRGKCPMCRAPVIELGLYENELVWEHREDDKWEDRRQLGS